MIKLIICFILAYIIVYNLMVVILDMLAVTLMLYGNKPIHVLAMGLMYVLILLYKGGVLF